MNIKYFLIPLSLLLWLNVFSQSAEEIKNNRKEYIYGEGVGSTVQLADRQALSELVSQISVTVESDFTHEVIEEEQGSGKSSFHDRVLSVVNTYSNATLNSTERMIVNDEPDARVLRYIRRSDISKIFNQRKQRINDFIEESIKYCEKAQIADALKYYYWSLLLLRSHPDANSLTLENNPSRPLLINWIPAQINDIFSNLTLSVKNWKQESNYFSADLQINYKGIPVRNFDYSWFDGRDWGAVVSAKDGAGFVEYPGNIQPESIKIKAEYMFGGEARADKELEQVMAATNPVPFRNALFIVGQAASKPSEEPNSSSSVVLLSTAGTLSVITEVKPYEEVIKKVATALETNNLAPVKSLFTPEGYLMMTQLSGYGKAKVLSSNSLKALKSKDRTMVRSLRMAFSFNDNKRFVEDLVFTFNDQKKIESIAFGLNQTALSDILNKEAWPVEQRMTIVSFLENYKTAYALKRLDYLESVFSDKALIIVGSYLKVNPTPENRFQNKVLRYNQMTKTEYLKNLESSFKSKEYINIEFEDNEIRKAMSKNGAGDIYGIQIKQNYYSSNYGDVGYLYLQVEFPNPDTPVIYVRTWKPEKNPDGSIDGISDF